MGLERTLLKVHTQRENAKEWKAWEDFIARSDKLAGNRKRSGIFGGLLGAIGGFLLGGVPGMFAGWYTGKNVGKWTEGENDEEKLKKHLNQQVFQGGKFNWRKDLETTKSARREVDKIEERMIMETALDAVSAWMSVNKAGGFMEEGEKQVWKNLTFGEKIKMTAQGSPISEESITKPGDKAYTERQTVAMGRKELKAAYGKDWKLMTKQLFDTQGVPAGTLNERIVFAQQSGILEDKVTGSKFFRGLGSAIKAPFEKTEKLMWDKTAGPEGAGDWVIDPSKIGEFDIGKLFKESNIFKGGSTALKVGRAGRNLMTGRDFNFAEIFGWRD